MKVPILLMTSLLKLLLFLSVITACSAQEKSVEDGLYQCLNEHFELNNIDLAASLDSLEDYLVKQGVLESKGGSGKLNFYKEIIRSGKVPATSEDALMKPLRDSYIHQTELLNCLKIRPDFDSTTFHQSKFYLTSQKILEEIKTHGTTPVTVSKAFVAHLTEADFEHPFYRAQMLLTFVMISERDKAYIGNLPTKIDPNEITSGGFTIDIRTPTVFIVDENNLSKEDLEIALVNYLQQFDETTYVQILVNSKTQYQHFSDLQIIISNSYNTFWNQISLKEYEKPFNKLNEGEQNDIKSRYPNRIREIDSKF